METILQYIFVLVLSVLCGAMAGILIVRPRTPMQLLGVVFITVGVVIAAGMMLFGLAKKAEGSPADYDDDEIMITEIAWAGTLAHPDHEWFELYNNTDYPIHLAGWTLTFFYTDRAGQNTIYIPETTIEPRQYAVFEREHDGVLSTPASGIYTDTIGIHNSGVQDVWLSNDEDHIRDLWMLGGSGYWPHGDYTAKTTAAYMEDIGEWGTEVEVSDVEDANGNFISGSPWVASTSAPDHGGQGLVLISEIAWMGTHANSSDEWFELYNNTDEALYLIDWKLTFYRTQLGPSSIVIPATVIEPGEYALFERTDDDTIPNRSAKNIFLGGLPNEDVHMVLLEDGVGFVQHLWSWDWQSGSWPEGSNSSKSSAHYFIGGQGWVTSNYSTGARDADGNLIFGSPGEENNSFWFSYRNYLPVVGSSDND